VVTGDRAAQVADLLAADLLAWEGSAPDGISRHVILWLDPNCAFLRLWPDVAASLRRQSVHALKCERGVDDQLLLKLALLELEGDPDRRGVVYLPGFDPGSLDPRRDGAPPELWSAYEYRYKGAVWSLADSWEVGKLLPPATLLGWLERHGVRLVDDEVAVRLTEGGRDSLLSRFVENQLRRPVSEWPSPLKESEVVTALGGDPRDALRALIAAPKNAVKLWGESAALTIGGIQAAYGLGGPRPNASPDELADAFAIQLALAEAWDAFGRPSDFPFRTRLPERVEQRERAARFLRTDVLTNTELAPRYRERVVRLEKDIDLTEWAAARPGQPGGLPLLARSRWTAFLAEFDALAKEDWRTACELLVASKETIAAGQRTPWDRVEGDSQWVVVSDLRQLVERAAEAAQELERAPELRELIAGYTQRWWKIDLLHLHVRAASGRVSGLESVRRIADLAYFRYAEEANDRFCALVAAAGSWPLEGIASVRTIAETLWRVERPGRAIVIVDALRWDLASGLRKDLAVELTPVLATIPTKTSFGMTALLPLGSREPEVGLKKAVSLRLDGTDLATRDGRKSFLSAALPKTGSKPPVGFIDMDDLLKGDALPDATLVVVFDNSIDEQGHAGTDELPGLAEQLVAKVRRTIERLHDRGIGEVHVVTDHGFLLLPADMVESLGKPTVLPAQVVRKEERWCALKPDSPVTGLIRLPLPLGDQPVVLGFPRGVRTLVVTGDFIHGGLSLQETVVPHVVSRAAVRPTRVRVDVAVTVPELVGGTVPVVIRPSVDGQATIEIKPVRVRLWIETSEQDAERAVAVTEVIEVEVRADVEELRPPMYLKEGLGIPAGQELVLRAVDHETGEDFATVPLTLKIAWE